ncbi:MAG: YdcF family protein [Pseudomonadota bacterium]
MALQHASSQRPGARVERDRTERSGHHVGAQARTARWWPRLRRWALVLVSIPAIVALAFVAFVQTLPRAQAIPANAADGIVVLTGGRNRIDAGVDLLAKGKARRLLISGVHRKTSRSAMARHFPTENRLYQCCIDLGRAALDTIGNANEAAVWTTLHDVQSLIVVTSSYHMPRALAEFRRAMPDVRMIPFAVVGREVQLDRWWQHPGTARLLAKEFVKYVPAMARLMIARMASRQNGQDDALAIRPAGMS